MKKYLLIAALLFSMDAFASDTITIHHVQFGQPGCIVFEKEKKIRNSDPNGWRYDFWEYHERLRGDVKLPKYYKDPIRGSNGGWELA